MAELHEDLGNGMVMRGLRDEADARAFVALSDAVTREGPICDRLVRHRPGGGRQDFFVVEDTRTGRVASTTCLLPWHLDFCGIPLGAAMLEMVVTHPDYRKLGLVRSQIGRFHRIADERAMDLCIIQGIPWYYRQFGYAYALDHRPRIQLPVGVIPDAWQPGTVEPCGDRDVADLQTLYDSGEPGPRIRVVRTAEDWIYLRERAGVAFRILRAREGRAADGYAACRIADGVLSVDEQAMRGAAAAQAFLAWAKRQAAGTVELYGPPQGALWQAARSLGGTVPPCGQWLLRIPDPVRLLSRIAPVIDARLAAAGFAHLEGALTINLFRTAIRLRFASGRLDTVEDAKFLDASMGAADPGDLLIPPDAFVRLVMGFRGIGELRDAWPELWVRPAVRGLVDALFPRLPSWIHMPY